MTATKRQKPGGEGRRRKNDKQTKADVAPPRSWLKKIFINALAAMVWGGVLAGGIVAYFMIDLPKVEEAGLVTRPHVRILDSRGWEIASFGDIYGPKVDLAKLPSYVPAAFIAVEDRRFYSHNGVDLRGIARAMIENVRAGGIVEGGSTITQQLAKNLYLENDRTWSRKIREALLAIELERTFTKSEILSLYLNRVYFGAGIYGLEAAADRYFDRPAKELSVYQAAVLAGLLKAPSRYNPTRDATLASRRAEIVLAAMVSTGVLTETEAAAARESAGKNLQMVVNPSSHGRYFADWVMAQVESYVGSVDRDIVVKTTLDGRLQSVAEKALRTRLSESGTALNAEQGALVVLGLDGSVKAMVGGRSYGESQFNRAAQALRQPGSAFKPFVYLAALEEGYRPSDLVDDAPITVAGWNPENFSKTYMGPVTLETALVNSLNAATVRLAQQIGPQKVSGVARRMGLRVPFPRELSISLGTTEVTLIDLAGAYVPFANGGDGVFTHAIRRIEDTDGAVLYERTGSGRGRVVDPAHVGTMNAMMSRVLNEGTGKSAAFGYPAAGKTGTSSGFRDAWFVGYTADYIAGVWVGNDSGSGMKGVTGGGLPARIWQEVMVAAHEGHTPRELPGIRPPEPDLPMGFLDRFFQLFAD